jgi:hypothetical protein
VMDKPINDETAHRDIAEYLGRVVDCEGPDADQWATDILDIVHAALQEPVAIPEYVKHVRMWRSGDGWDVFIKRNDDTHTAFSTTDPIAAIRNAVEAGEIDG